MKTQRTIYHIVVDKSGSMGDCIPMTIEGYNEQVARIRELSAAFPEQDMQIGLTTFNGQVEHKFVCQPATEAYLMNSSNYVPSGNTALLDAIGKSIALIDEKKAASDHQLPTTVVMVILTDGYENASRHYQLKEVKEMIESRQESGSWTFSYLGATLDAVDIAEQMSIKRNNSVAFEKEGMKEAVWNKLSHSMHEYYIKKQKGQDLSDLF